jgi:hypothetical protein
VAIGEIPPRDSFTPTVERVVAERALISAPGTVASIASPELAPDEHLFINCRSGDTVGPPRNNVEKVANVIVSGRTATEADGRAAELLERIEIRLRPGDPGTDAFLFKSGRSSRWSRFSLTEAAHAELDKRPAFRGALQDVRTRLVTTGTLPVTPLPEKLRTNEGLQARIPGSSARKVLEDLVKAGGIIYEYESPAADGAFWSAFLASGRQGYHYLVDSLIAEVGQW